MVIISAFGFPNFHNLMSKQRYKVSEVETALRKSGGLKSGAAQILGCDRRTIHNYCERYPRLAEIEEQHKMAMLDAAKKGIWDSIRAGHFPACKWYAAVFGGWVEPTRIEGPSGGPIQVVSIHAHLDMSTEDEAAKSYAKIRDGAEIIDIDTKRKAS